MDVARQCMDLLVFRNSEDRGRELVGDQVEVVGRPNGEEVADRAVARDLEVAEHAEEDASSQGKTEGTIHCSSLRWRRVVVVDADKDVSPAPPCRVRRVAH